MPRSARSSQPLPMPARTFSTGPIQPESVDAPADAPTQFSSDEDERNKEAKWLMLADKVLGPVEQLPAKLAK